MERLTDCGWMPMMGYGFLSMVLFWAVLVQDCSSWGDGSGARVLWAERTQRSKFSRKGTRTARSTSKNVRTWNGTYWR